MSRKRLSKQEQVDLDAERLNDALDELVAQFETVIGGAESDMQRHAIQTTIRLNAIKAMPALLERKAKLLGLDHVAPADSPGQAASGSLAELEKKLALVK